MCNIWICKCGIAIGIICICICICKSICICICTCLCICVYLHIHIYIHIYIYISCTYTRPCTFPIATSTQKALKQAQAEALPLSQLTVLPLGLLPRAAVEVCIEGPWTHPKARLPALYLQRIPLYISIDR